MQPDLTNSMSVKRIAVATCDALVRRLIQNTLDSADYEIVENLPGSDEAIHLILMDGNPLVADVEEYTRVRVQWTQTPFLFLWHPEEAPPTCLPWPEVETLNLPFSPMDLLKKVYAILGSDEPSNGALQPLHQLERQQLLLYAQDLARVRKEDDRKAQQLKAANAKLQEFEKMKDMFLALVSHELRTPLTVMKGNTHLLRRFLKDAEPGSREDKMAGFVGSLGLACERLENLVSDLMSYSSVRCGVEPFELRKVDLRSVLTTVLREHEGLAQTKLIHLEFIPDQVDTIMLGDSQRLKEAFSHLIKNAIYFNVPKGKVTVRCEKKDGQLLLSVTDTGPGVPPEERERVFAPFYQAQDLLTRRVEGVGLGLAITRHIIESHGGQIWLAGELGQGTQVWVSLPISPPDYTDSEFAPRPPDEFEALMSEHQEVAALEYARELYSAYDRERLRRRHVEDRANELEKTFLETLAALMRQVDMRNHEQTSHNDKVVLIANEIARKIDPALPQSRDFQLSLLLHDVGKIGIAEKLLQKAGKLTNEETQLVRSHVQVGAEILGSIEFLRPALATVRHHHERWDGRGYPDGLSGVQIPLWARILSVADSFGAMITERPYRRALTLEQARLEIKSQSGSQYDPEVVSAFESIYDTIQGLI